MKRDDLPSVPADSALSRRTFLGSGAALVMSFHLGAEAAAAKAAPAVLAPNAYLRIGADDKIALVVALVEMGQGTFTSVPMLIAEELDVDLAQLTIEQAPADEARYGHPLYVKQITGGSAGIRGAWAKLRLVGATTRLMLVTAAANTWQVPVSECRTQSGVVTHAPTGRQLRYGQLVAAASQLPVPAEAPLKAQKDFRLVGTRAHRPDTPSKVNGTAKFGIDATAPGMKIAALAICPVFGGKVGTVDDKAARKVRGVRDVLVSDDAVAVVADHNGAAKKGLAALKITWNEGKSASFSSAAWQKQLTDALKQPGITPVNEGDFDAAWKAGAQRLEATYLVPPLAHATMEPLNCLLHIRKDGAEVWLGTQAPARVQRLVAQAAGLPPEKVVVHNHLIGGGFGRKLEADYVETAAKLVKQVRYPVKVIFSREEDFQHDAYKPMFVDQLSAALDKDGKPLGLLHRFSGASVLARYEPAWLTNGLDTDAVHDADSIYPIAARRVNYVRHEAEDGPMTGNWRGVGPTHHAFVTECFIDEMAAAAKADPVAYRAGLLATKPRALNVLKLAAEKAQWGKAAPKGSGRGVAVLDAFGSYGALVTDVTVAADGTLKVDRMVFVVDCGQMINPEGVEAQVQGGLVFGLSAALYGPVTIENGRVMQSNFHDHPVLRNSETPKIEVHLVQSSEPPGGMGEVSTPLVVPSLLNAIFVATGKRLRTYPVVQDQLRTA
ncbi:molybdopterin cofactor-binding domain-containing protein [Roseateles sp. P5_E11]